MRIPPSVLDTLDLDKAISFCLKEPLDRLPPLITDICFSDARETVRKWISAFYTEGETVSSEMIVMPKTKFGHRPVLISPFTSRVIYHALVQSVQSSLEPDSRSGDAWETHDAFVIDSPAEYFVEIDIAACYEFIDHKRLRQELVSRTLAPSSANSIVSYLEECTGDQRGLPQLTKASDRLADLYLSYIERRLMRKGFEVSRYADDFRVRAKTWEEANDVIEYAAEFAREIGLILSYGKTSISRTSSFASRVRSQEENQKKYFDGKKQKLTLTHIMGQRYGSEVVIEIAPNDARLLKASMRMVVRHWMGLQAVHSGTPEIENTSEGTLRRLLPMATLVLQDSDRLSDDFFCRWVGRDPIRLERVCRYMLYRHERFNEPHENWRLLRALTESGRLTPWARLWLLHVASHLHPVSGADFPRVKKWISAQLADRHECVRAEAAWACAKLGELKEDTAVTLLREATQVSQCGIAAAMGKQGDMKDGIAKSVTAESELLREAFNWGKKQ